MDNEPKAYLVAGDTGEYSYHRAWYIRIFLVEKEANDFCKKLNDWCVANGLDPNGKNTKEYYNCHELKNPDDPEFEVDYTGTSYCVIELPLGMAKEYNVPNRES